MSGVIGSERLALTGARICRVDRAGERVALDRDVAAVLVADGRIAATGDERVIVQEAGSGAEVVDLHGAVLAPGFVDAHIHAFDCALGSLAVSCLPPTVDGIVTLKDRLRERAEATTPGGWVVGQGYDDMRLTDRRHPTRHDLDEAVADRPAVVTRVCGHMSVANTEAMRLAGIDGDTEDPPGGSIVRDAAGSATGLLLETAQDLVLSLVPDAEVADIKRALVRTGRMLLARGVTTICEALLGPFHALEIDIWAGILAEGWEGPDVVFLADPAVASGAIDMGLPVIGTKLFADGVITGRTAALSRAFEQGTEVGMLIHEPDELAEKVRRSIEMGLPVGIHAMGDRGIATAIGAIQHGMDQADERGGQADLPRHLSHPHRIEHCTLPDPASLDTMLALGIVPVPQPVFLFAEGEAYLAQLGRTRSAGAYPLRTMRELGLRPALSSDAPATSSEDAANPWLGIAAAATRRTWAGTELGRSEAITVGEAIAGYTVDGATVLSLQDRIGAIDVGMDADLVAYEDDPLEMGPDDLMALRPELVLKNGRIAFRRDEG